MTVEGDYESLHDRFDLIVETFLKKKTTYNF